MKKLLTIILIISSYCASAQSDFIRTRPVGGVSANLSTYNKQTVSDANLKAALTLYIPRGATPTLNNAKDSLGAVFFKINAAQDTSFYVYHGNDNWVRYAKYSDIVDNAWSLTGNVGTDPLINFIGTNDTKDLSFKTNNIERIRITSNGNIGIGSTLPTEKLDIDGNIRFSGALMPNNDPGTSGQVLKSAGVGLSPTWQTSITSLNGLSSSAQLLNTGTIGTDFAISSTGSTHTFNIPTSSAINRGLLSPTDWSTFNSKESVLTFSNGLTRTSNTIRNNLSTGISGGQSVIGGTDSGNNLTLSSTINLIKGKIIIGTSAYDENSNRLGIGTLAPSQSIEVIGNIYTSNELQFKSQNGTGKSTFKAGNQGNVNIDYILPLEILDDGYVLSTTVSGELEWINPDFNRSVYNPIKTVTSNYSVLGSDHTILVDATGGNIIITMPLASSYFANGKGLQLMIKRMDNTNNLVTIQRAFADLLDGGTSVSLTSQYQTRQFQSAGGTQWIIF